MVEEKRLEKQNKGVMSRLKSTGIKIISFTETNSTGGGDKTREPYRGVINYRGSKLKLQKATTINIQHFAQICTWREWHQLALCNVINRATHFVFSKRAFLEPADMAYLVQQQNAELVPTNVKRVLGRHWIAFSVYAINQNCRITIVRQIPKISDLLQSQPTAATNR